MLINGLTHSIFSKSFLLIFTLIISLHNAELHAQGNTNAPEIIPGEFIIKLKREEMISALRANSDNLYKRFKLRNKRSIKSINSFKVELFSFIGLKQRESYSEFESLLVEQRIGRLTNMPDRLSEQMEFIEYIEPNYKIHPSATTNDPYLVGGNLWALNSANNIDINGVEAWSSKSSDANVVVGVIDTGVDYTHPDLAANMWKNPHEIPNNKIDDDANGVIDDIYGYNVIDKLDPLKARRPRAEGDPWDTNFHGTHVAGTIAAVGNNNLGVVGVVGPTSKVKIVALRIFNDQMYGSLSAAIAAYNYIVALNAKGTNVRVINNSWALNGLTSEPLSLRDAIHRAENAGILTVAAAGNENSNNDLIPIYPANTAVSSVLSVAAIGKDGFLGKKEDGITQFSNYGPNTVDLAAPGVDILSTVPENIMFMSYYSARGTSMASPHVAGAAALVASRSPLLSSLDIKNTLLKTIKPITGLRNKMLYPGIIDLKAALDSLTTISPALNIATQPRSQTVNAGQTFTFSVIANGTGPFFYQWYKNNSIINGATSASYSFGPATLLDNQSQFKCIVRNATQSISSSAAVLTVNSNSLPIITVQPQSKTLTPGTAITLYVTASSNSALSYQWQRNGVNISGATKSSYTFLATSLDNGARYRCLITNSSGSINSSEAIVTVRSGNLTPTITFSRLGAIAQNFTVKVGQNADLLVELNDPENVEVQIATNLLPSGAQYVSVPGPFPSGTFKTRLNWTPTITQANKTYNITVSAFDGVNFASKNVALSVVQ